MYICVEFASLVTKLCIVMEAPYKQSRVLLRFIAMKCCTQKLSRDEQMPIMFSAILRVV
jgi:hypothetical protein